MAKRRPTDLELYPPRRYPPQDLRPGDRGSVRYARAFLLWTDGGDRTDPRWRAEGTVVERRGDFVRVHWDGADEPILVALGNVGRRVSATTCD